MNVEVSFEGFNKELMDQQGIMGPYVFYLV
jgi:hypothetical protein